jgi:hypothetical protein
MAAYLPCRDSYHPELCLQYARAVSDRSRGTAGGIFLLEPVVAEHWETPDDTSYLFQLRHGVNTCGALDTHKIDLPSGLRAKSQVSSACCRSLMTPSSQLTP